MTSRHPPSIAKPQWDAALVIGCTNFAHHLWNELSALAEWLDAATDERLSRLVVLATQEPLGPIDVLFPRLSSNRVKHIVPSSLESEAREAPIAVRVGSHFVSERARLAVREFSQTLSSSPQVCAAMDLLNDSWPKIWVSARIKTRTADNLVPFLLGFFRNVISTYPRAAILIDGFSFPYQFFNDPRMSRWREPFSRYAKDVQAFIAGLLAQAETETGPAVAARLCSISGIEITDAIGLGAHCDYYVCHAGTLQHKIGWLHNIPGFIHGLLGGGGWHGNQAEGGITPDVFPTGFLVQTSRPPRNPHTGWNDNYCFLDPKKSAEFVFRTMLARIGASQPSAANVRCSARQGQATVRH